MIQMGDKQVGQKSKVDGYLTPRPDLLVLIGSPRLTKRYPKLQGCFACSFDSSLTDEVVRSFREADCPMPCVLQRRSRNRGADAVIV